MHNRVKTTEIKEAGYELCRLEGQERRIPEGGCERCRRELPRRTGKAGSIPGRRRWDFSGVFVLQIEDGFFVLADVKLYRNVSIAVVHEGSFPCRFSTTLSIKTSPLPAGRYREKRSKRGQGICPCKYKNRSVLREQRGRFLGLLHEEGSTCVSSA